MKKTDFLVWKNSSKTAVPRQFQVAEKKEKIKTKEEREAEYGLREFGIWDIFTTEFTKKSVLEVKSAAEFSTFRSPNIAFVVVTLTVTLDP